MPETLVVAELLQAIGRGRGYLPEGIPVYVVSNENLARVKDGVDARNTGYLLADEGRYAPLTDAQVKVLAALHREGGQRVYRRTGDLVGILGVCEQRVKELLAELEAAGRVRRVGGKPGPGGWVAEPR
jgi:hypothetical protein